MPSKCAAPTTATTTLLFSPNFQSEANEYVDGASRSSPLVEDLTYAGVFDASLTCKSSPPATRHVAAKSESSRRETRASKSAVCASSCDFSFVVVGSCSPASPKALSASSTSCFSRSGRENTVRVVASNSCLKAANFVPVVLPAVSFDSTAPTKRDNVSETKTSPSTTTPTPPAIAWTSAATVSNPAGDFWSRRIVTISSASSDATRYARAAGVVLGVANAARAARSARAAKANGTSFVWFSFSFSSDAFSSPSSSPSLCMPTMGGNVRSLSTDTDTHTTPPSSTSVGRSDGTLVVLIRAPGHADFADA
mmetsp:Transcript_5970/g.22583  ORF Transcript_5970/g.22583 Transcript_5970/m.22583 type:complete len:309 (+) Transcript_5970:876-1802(+)